MFAVNLVTGVVDDSVPSGLSRISVTYNGDGSYSVLTIADAFVSDSGNYTCSVTCAAERVVNGVLEQVPMMSRETRSVTVQGTYVHTYVSA